MLLLVAVTVIERFPKISDIELTIFIRTANISYALLNENLLSPHTYSWGKKLPFKDLHSLGMCLISSLLLNLLYYHHFFSASLTCIVLFIVDMILYKTERKQELFAEL